MTLKIIYGENVRTSVSDKLEAEVIMLVVYNNSGGHAENRIKNSMRSANKGAVFPKQFYNLNHY